MVKWWGHLKTITAHKVRVMKLCFRVGLYRQGLLHDLSKYGPREFLVGAKYYQGNRSPNEIERLEKGYSSAWLHHKGRNKHHLEYWIDYAPELGYRMGGMEMPVNYVAEMFCDRVAACQIYQKERYQCLALGVLRPLGGPLHHPPQYRGAAGKTAADAAGRGGRENLCLYPRPGPRALNTGHIYTEMIYERRNKAKAPCEGL